MLRTDGVLLGKYDRINKKKIGFNVAYVQIKNRRSEFLYSPRLSFLFARVEVTDKCRHKVVDQSLAPSEKAAISSMFSS